MKHQIFTAEGMSIFAVSFWRSAMLHYVFSMSEWFKMIGVTAKSISAGVMQFFGSIIKEFKNKTMYRIAFAFDRNSSIAFTVFVSGPNPASIGINFNTLHSLNDIIESEG